MGELKVTKESTTYILEDGTFRIKATKYMTGKITIVPINDRHDTHNFCFVNSNPEVAYAIGNLIANAADVGI